MSTELLKKFLELSTAAIQLVSAVVSLIVLRIGYKKSKRDIDKTREAVGAIRAANERQKQSIKSFSRIDQRSDKLERRVAAIRSPAPPNKEIRRFGKMRERRVLKAAIAATFLFVIVGAGLWIVAGTDYTAENRTVETEIGELRSVPLEDGSVVALNTSSTITTKFTNHERRIALERGEARFTVMKDPTRPFVVETAQADVVAVGTIFNVRLGEAERTSVAVLEGKVQVRAREPEAGATNVGSRNSPEKPSKRDLTLATNELASVTADGQIMPGKGPSIARVSGWPGNQLIFVDEPLPTVIAELNRYSREPIRIADPELHECIVTASILTNERDKLLGILQTTLSVRAVRNEGQGYSLYKDDSGADNYQVCEPQHKVTVPADSRFLGPGS